MTVRTSEDDIKGQAEKYRVGIQGERTCLQIPAL
jgi:hypothetical protein